jgi:exodeoxyribonuclease-3
LRLATWNINSVKARTDTVIAWLKEASPDVVCLQEIKCEDHAFPREPFEALGYNIAVHGQKSFNGVAILAKQPLEDVRSGLPGDDADNQARYLEATVAGIRIACVYLPNGNPPDTEKYPYKLRWMDRLAAHAQALLGFEEPLAIMGDYNVIPAALDAARPETWLNDALFLPQSRARFRQILNLGFTEALRAINDSPGIYTFWDYQAGAWQKNNGIRIDHALLSPQAADRLVSVRVDSHVRAWEKPSDHVPLVVELLA